MHDKRSEYKNRMTYNRRKQIFPLQEIHCLFYSRVNAIRSKKKKGGKEETWQKEGNLPWYLLISFANLYK